MSILQALFKILSVSIVYFIFYGIVYYLYYRYYKYYCGFKNLKNNPNNVIYNGRIIRKSSTLKKSAYMDLNIIYTVRYIENRNLIDLTIPYYGQVLDDVYNINDKVSFCYSEDKKYKSFNEDSIENEIKYHKRILIVIGLVIVVLTILFLQYFINGIINVINDKPFWY